MSASDAVPLPRQGEVFFDVRSDSRTMRLSWYAGTGVAVFSIWQGGVCTGTFRLPLADLPRMIETLRTGPARSDGPEADRATSRHGGGPMTGGGHALQSGRDRAGGRHSGGPAAGDSPPEHGYGGEASRYRRDPTAARYRPQADHDGGNPRYGSELVAGDYPPQARHDGGSGRYPREFPAADYPPQAGHAGGSGRYPREFPAADYPPQAGHAGGNGRYAGDLAPGDYPPGRGGYLEDGRYSAGPAGAGYLPERNGGRYADEAPTASLSRSPSSAYSAAGRPGSDSADPLTVVHYSAAYPAPGSFSYASTGQAPPTDYASPAPARDSCDDANTVAYFESAASSENAGARPWDSRAGSPEPAEFPSVPAAPG
jgi:hypothetical protein